GVTVARCLDSITGGTRLHSTARRWPARGSARRARTVSAVVHALCPGSATTMSSSRGFRRTRRSPTGGPTRHPTRGLKRPVPALSLSRLLRIGEGRTVKRLAHLADEVIAIGPDYEDLTDAELRAKTEEFKQRYADGETLDDLLLEAFAVAREASWRVLNQKHYKVQIMGGAALHLGNIAEMKTGEGKTLTCVLPAYLNALSGEGVHVVTVNDYLAKRDAEWMGRVHRFLGLEVGVILGGM